MNILALISLLSFLAYIYLGTVVYLRNPKNPVNQAFFIFSLVMAYAGFTDFQMRVSESYASALFWFRAGMLWHLALSALIHFVLVFVRKSRKRYDKWIYISLYVVGMAFVMLDFFGNRVVEGPIQSQWGWSYGDVLPSMVGATYEIWNAGMMILGFVLCFRHYLKSGDEARQQAKYVLIGSSILIATGVLELLFSHWGMQAPDILHLGFTIGSCFWGFAVWKYELFVLTPVSSAKEIIQTMSDALLLISPERRIKVVNEAALELLGYERHELIDQQVRVLFDKSDYQAIIEGVIPGELALRGFVSDVEIPVRSKQGRKIIVSMAASMVRDNADQFQGIAVISRDITRRKKDEQELQRYKVHLEEVVAERTAELEKTYAQLQRVQKLEFMGTIAGGVAHDLNNILSGLSTYPELLLLDLPEESPMRKPLTTIQKSGEKAAVIVQDLLTLARREVVIKSVVNLNTVITEYVQSPEHKKLLAYHPHAQLLSYFETDLLNLIGSPIHLSKALMNLVRNAIEAMPDGGQVTVSTANRSISEERAGYETIEAGQYVALSVSDTGTGIAPEDLEHIFEPFYTKKKMGKSGTGLGMAVVWGTVKDHGGYVDVASERGKGDHLYTLLPCLHAPIERCAEHDAAGAIDGQRRDHTSGRRHERAARNRRQDPAKIGLRREGGIQRRSSRSPCQRASGRSFTSGYDHEPRH